MHNSGESGQAFGVAMRPIRILAEGNSKFAYGVNLMPAYPPSEKEVNIERTQFVLQTQINKSRDDFRRGFVGLGQKDAK